MDLYVVVLRLLHIVFGVLWVGFACFVPFILLPSLMDAGPAAGPVMGVMQRRGLPKIMSAFAGITILAGILLLWRVSGGFRPEYMGSHMGIALSTGALAALIAFAIGMMLVKPAMTRAGILSEGLASATSDADRAALMATIGALRTRGAAGARWVAWLLLVAVVAMAAARYL
jgi:hypothetical protein